MSTPLLSIGSAPLALDTVLEAATDRGSATGADGAVATFVGLVRNNNVGRRVMYLDYEAFDALALRAFSRISEEIASHWPGVRLALHHRTGRVEIGDASVVIAAASAHRAHAFSACRYAIERIKQIAPIWKREVFEGGEVWIEGATADPDDAAAKAHAERLACA